MRGLLFRVGKTFAAASFVVFFVAFAKAAEFAAADAWQGKIGFDLAALLVVTPVFGLGALIEKAILRPFLSREFAHQ